MLPYPQIDPIAFRIGPVSVYWYGIMYLIGFGGGWWLGRRRAREVWRGWREEQVDDLVFYIVLGVVLGGRLGYVFFYDFNNFISNPVSLFKVWQGGMSFHGGLIGVITAMWIHARMRGTTFFNVADFIAPLATIGLGAGRLGNFINVELWGKETDLPWGMVFPDPRAGGVARHPSQLYEMLLEGVVLFIVLWLFSKRPRPAMATSALFLLLYGVFRFSVEFVRIPDAQYGYLAFGWVTMGQLLSLPMVLAGALMLWYAYTRTPAAPPKETSGKGKKKPSGKKRKR
ncbi:MAG: prolipoprotein diacylglyceryl transferase [Gammaproteobacteria bacterium]|nr:prolipoprotein diacylglyceryl transferase [Gammaproteobacteria bacterium]